MALPKQTDPQFKLRLSPELKARIEASAARNNRTLNAEIVDRLEVSFGPSNPDHEVGPARERVLRAMAELKEALGDLEMAEMLG